ncbi:MAG: ATP-binding cassette domain-containing protein [Butyrivibrio sp.]|nr:ATP-binding cassette domain-containing protein [Butyrivibrio sp.]
MTDIQIDALCIAYDGRCVLKDFSHNFARGSFTSLIAPSGFGKTSLINAVMGLIPYDGSIGFSEPPLISAVFQEDRLCEGLTAMRNVAMTAARSHSRLEILNAFEAVGLGGCAGRRVCLLSGGMKRRTAILRALFAEHNLLLLDEPFKGLDEKTKALTMAFVKEKTSSDTVIMITHDTEEAMYFSSDIINPA